MHPSHALRVCATTIALTTILALGLAPAALGDDWARERAAVARAVDGLDPAIRTAVAARSSEVATSPAVVVPTPPAVDEGFAWGAAALGLGAGIAGMCVLLGCVTLVRHDGRLRSA
jgi:hypothetical protein